jgi:hypothetical protein
MSKSTVYLEKGEKTEKEKGQVFIFDKLIIEGEWI